MQRKAIATFQATCLVLLTLVYAGSAYGAMEMKAVSLPLPTNNKPHKISGLSYSLPERGELTEINSIRLTLESQEGENPVRATWTLGGSNNLASTQKADLFIYLLDHKGRRIAVVKKTVFFKPAAKNAEFVLHMKVKSKKWQRAERVQIQVNFLVK